MDAEIKAKWIKALRSGKYKQGVGYLNKDDSFCCLGVLCDISNVGGWESDPEIEACKRYIVGLDWNRATLPLVVAEKFDVPTATPLITMNDGGRSFDEIADYIEANL